MAEHLQKQSAHSVNLKPAADQVHVWYILAEAEGLDACQHPLESCLAHEEQAKYQGLKRPAVRLNFLLSRGCLRYLLSHYLGLSPQSLEFSFGPHGKPALTNSEGQPMIQFNLSHSQNRIAIALHAHQPLGIDLEQVRPVTHLEGLCQRCLTPSETKTVLELETHQAERRFLQYWTVKEAILKAIGVGLHLPMEQIAVDLGSDEISWQPRRVPLSFPMPSDFMQPEHGQVQNPLTLYQWQPEPHYLAAVAIEGAYQTGLPEIVLHQTTPSALVEAESLEADTGKL